MYQYNHDSLDTLCGALCYAMGVEPPGSAAPANDTLCRFVDEAFGGQKADRIFMYNPDAVAQWLVEKYPNLFEELFDRTQLKLPLCSVMPSVTPVCFGTMYTGAQPAVHGIQKYEKPVIRIDTIFDALIRAGKKVAILATPNCSLSKIFLEREADYFVLPSVDDVNACAARLIMEDKHDLIVCYNGNYDARMHKFGPESVVALAEMRCNVRAFAELNSLIKTFWTNHRTLMGFAMDHGCHEIDDDCGSPGLDMPEDLNICHFYTAIKGGSV